MRLRQAGELFQVEDRAARIADRLAIKRTRLRRDRRLPRREIAWIAQRNFQRQLLQRLLELRDRAAIKMRRGNDLVAGRKQGHQRDELRRHAARHDQCARRAFQRGQPLLQHRGRGIADARVDVSVLLQLEKLCRHVRAIEDIGGRLIDRHRPRARDRVRNMPGMDHARVEAELAWRWARTHESITLAVKSGRSQNAGGDAMLADGIDCGRG